MSLQVAISGLDFAYSQSPVRSRSTVSSIWALTSAVGNLLVIILSLLPLAFDVTFFIYAGLMLVVLFIFVPLAKSYTYVEIEQAPSS